MEPIIEEIEEAIGDTVKAVKQEPASPVESIDVATKAMDGVDVVLQESTLLMKHKERKFRLKSWQVMLLHQDQHHLPK